MIQGVNKPIDEQLVVLEEILSQNEKLMAVLKILEEYSENNSTFKNYYLGAGGVNQTVFNYYHGNDLNYGIKDFDIVYYDEDESWEAEDVIIKELSERLKGIDVEFDIKNQSRVYIWYKEKYGVERVPYSSVEDSIASWGATITCIGVRLEKGKFKVYCPYGLNDIFSMTVRSVKKEFTKEQYEERAKRWKDKWPLLTIKEW